MNTFTGTGNLGTHPEAKTVKIGDDERTVVEFRVFFDRSVPDGEGGFTEKGGFWRTVQIWKEGLQHRVLEHLSKGARIFIIGVEVASQWQDEHAQPRESYDLVADYVAVDLIGVADITFKERKAA